jgi:hypothetical protein
MFGIIDDNKKFILLDSDHDKLRATALMLAKEVTETVPDIDYETGNKFGEHTETHYEPMFTEETVDEAIAEYADKDIETAYNGDKYLKGFAPAIDNEYQSKQREIAYIAEVDPITAHIQRLRDDEPESEEIAKLIAERTEKRNAIRERYPYSEQ